MNYLEQLKKRAEGCGNILCMGIDPEIEKIPLKAGTEEAIIKFYLDIFDAIESEGIKFPAIKPNIAFFEQYGFDGLRALKSIIERAKKMDFQIILDAKRGDIGKTAKAYADSAFRFWGADAITIHPYLGSDSIFPFLEEEHGAYVQVRNSNSSAGEMQDLITEGKKVYEKVAEFTATKWHKPGLGAVVGATYPSELSKLSSYFVSSGKHVPMLIPGVGSQGGSAEEVMKILRETKNPLWLHRVNSSSGISYAYMKEKSDDYTGCAVKEIRKLIQQLRI